jgi:hypothetical protein
VRKNYFFEQQITKIIWKIGQSKTFYFIISNSSSAAATAAARGSKTQFLYFNCWESLQYTAGLRPEKVCNAACAPDYGR